MLKALAVVGARAVIAAGVVTYLFGTTAIAALRALPTFDISSTNPDCTKARQTAGQHAKVTTDADALESLDSQGLDTFDSGIRAAGFTPATGPATAP